MPSKIITNELKQEVINYYLSKPMGFEAIRVKFNLSLPTIGKILQNIPKYSKAQIFSPELNEHIFHRINNELSAYFLGLIIADGNVFKDNTGRQASISITLDLQDKYILEKFKDFTKTTTAIALDGRGCGQIAVRSNIMAQDLSQYGVIPRKTTKTYLPNIPDDYMPHLIRGILDGDGSVYVKEKNNTITHTISFCGTHQLMADISNYCYTHLNFNIKPTVYDYKDRQLSEIKIQNWHDVLIFISWIYKDATIYLIRKKDLCDNIIKYGNTEITN